MINRQFYRRVVIIITIIKMKNRKQKRVEKEMNHICRHGDDHEVMEGKNRNRHVNTHSADEIFETMKKSSNVESFTCLWLG